MCQTKDKTATPTCRNSEYRSTFTVSLLLAWWQWFQDEPIKSKRPVRTTTNKFAKCNYLGIFPIVRSGFRYIICPPYQPDVDPLLNPPLLCQIGSNFIPNAVDNSRDLKMVFHFHNHCLSKLRRICLGWFHGRRATDPLSPLLSQLNWALPKIQILQLIHHVSIYPQIVSEIANV